MPQRLDLTPEELRDRQRTQKREHARRRRGEDTEALTGQAGEHPIAVPSARRLRTVEGLAELQHRLVRAVCQGVPGAAEKARVLSPYLRSMAELVQANETRNFRRAIEDLRSGNPVAAVALLGGPVETGA